MNTNGEKHYRHRREGNRCSSPCTRARVSVFWKLVGARYTWRFFFRTSATDALSGSPPFVVGLLVFDYTIRFRYNVYPAGYGNVFLISLPPQSCLFFRIRFFGQIINEARFESNTFQFASALALDRVAFSCTMISCCAF